MSVQSMIHQSASYWHKRTLTNEVFFYVLPRLYTHSDVFTANP